MTLIKLPDTVRRADVLAFTRQVGLDPATVRALEIVTQGVWVTVYAVSPEGRRMAVGEDAACHRLFIPFDTDIGQP